MATTTPNFGWPVPTSTDLVKDGATAIEALGDSIDASLLDLKGGTTGQVLSKNSNTDMDFTWVTDAAGDITGVTAGTGISGGGTSGTVTVTNSMATAIDAKGDLVAGTAADTFARLAVGTNGQILTADSVETTGMKWATPAGGGGMTLLSTTTLSGSSTTVSSISGAYKDLYILVVNQNGGGGQVLLKPNNTANCYGSGATSNNGGTTSAYTIYNDWLGTNAYGNSSNTTNFYQVYFNNYASTTAYKPFQYQGGHLTDASVRHNAFSIGYLQSNSAVSSIVVACESGSFSAGTIYVYGVS